MNKGQTLKIHLEMPHNNRIKESKVTEEESKEEDKISIRADKQTLDDVNNKDKEPIEEFNKIH